MYNNVIRIGTYAGFTYISTEGSTYAPEKKYQMLEPLIVWAVGGLTNYWEFNLPALSITPKP